MGISRNPAKAILTGVDLDTLKQFKKDEIMGSRKKAIENGCITIPTRIGSIDFWTSRDAQSDIGHYVQEVGLAMIMGQQPQGITRQWKTASGIIDLPGDVAVQLGKDLADWVQAQFAHEATLCFIVDIAKIPEEVSAISWGMEISESVRQKVAAFQNEQKEG